MFNFSFSELLIVALVSILTLGPKESVNALKNLGKYASKFKDWYQSYINYFQNELDVENVAMEKKKEKELVNYIVDLEGNLQQTYDLSDIMPEIEETKQK